MGDRTSELECRIKRDFADPRLAFPGVRFVPAAEWAYLVPATNDPQRGSDSYRVTDLVCVSGGHSFLVDGAMDDEHLLAQMASTLQDDAIDRLGAPWPSLEIEGQFRGVLEPHIDEDGVAVWASSSGFSCPIGTLQDTFGAAEVIT